MSDETTVDVSVMGQDFRIHCNENEREGLLLAVDFLNKKMREIKSNGKIVGTERIAIAAALNITHELLNMQSGRGFDIKEFRRRIGLIEPELDDTLLESSRQL